MANRLVVPDFVSEDEEAEWVWKHRHELDQEMARRIRAGTAMGGPRKNLDDELQPVSIRLSKRDVQTAREQASERGIRYQTYIRMILHRALRKQAREKR